MTKKDLLRGKIRHGKAKRTPEEPACGFWKSVLTGILTAISAGLVVTAASAAALMATPDPLKYSRLCAAGILFAAELICAYVAVRKCGKASAGIVAGTVLALLFFSFAVFSADVGAETAFITGGMALFSILGAFAGSRKIKAK
ncbi:MAG: hypothetical protein J5940_01035 [Clostridia bacterium]|nr:hypothetical protein [Clostridia bacterium]